MAALSVKDTGSKCGVEPIFQPISPLSLSAHLSTWLTVTTACDILRCVAWERYQMGKDIKCRRVIPFRTLVENNDCARMTQMTQNNVLHVID